MEPLGDAEKNSGQERERVVESSNSSVTCLEFSQLFSVFLKDFDSH